MEKIIKKCVRYFRKLLGTQQLVEQLAKNQDELLQQLHTYHAAFKIELSNMALQIMHLQKIKETVEYNRYQTIIALLKPKKVNHRTFIRVGKKGDGGYTMLDYPDWALIESAYSFGISNDVSWDNDIADRGITVYMYDHTIDELPKQHSHFRYFKWGVTGFQKNNELKTLKEFLKINGHEQSQQLILKMDIEGNEWDVLDETDSDTIHQFSQIIFELHDITNPSRYSTIIRVLEKINLTHQSVHIHYNNHKPPLMLGDLVLSWAIEILFVRRCDVEFSDGNAIFPTPIDQPNHALLPDIFNTF